MRRSALTVALVLLASGGFTALAAQHAPAHVGTWAIEFSRGVRMENGEATHVMAKGTLAVAPSGDSLVATLDQPPRADGTATPPATFGGRVRDGQAVFVQKRTVQLNLGGEARSVDAVVTWTLKATGDTLTGSVSTEIPSMPMPDREPGPVRGTRVKS